MTEYKAIYHLERMGIEETREIKFDSRDDDGARDIARSSYQKDIFTLLQGYDVCYVKSIRDGEREVPLE